MGRRQRRGYKIVTAAMAAVIAAVSGTLLVVQPAGATTLTQLTAASFLDNAVAVNQWTLPAGTTTNQACLTAGPTTSATSVPDCSPTSDTNGAGALQLTTDANNQVGSVFNTTSLPTSQGLDVQFDSYQFTPGTTSRADGISFSLSAANPASPSAPSSTGQLGGALGYSTNQSGAGIPDGYLGVGLDVYGNYLNASYGGSACPADGSLGNQKYPQSVTVRGPGQGTTGYCIVATTADTSAPSTTDNLPGGTGTLDETAQSTHAAADDVPVEVAINSGSTSTTTGSGLVVPAGSFAVAFTPVGGTSHTITGALPSLIGNSLGIPSSWYDPTTGVPYQLNFGWTASTGSANEVHDINTLTSQTVSGSLPEYSLSDVDNNSGVHNLQASGQSITLTPSLDPASQSASADSDPPTVTDRFPSGVVPGTPTGTSWNCAGSSGQTVSCVYDGTEPVAAGTTYPSLTVPLSVTGASTPGANADAAEVSSDDGLPARAADDFSVVWPPGAPAVTSATPLDASAGLTWSAPSGNGGAITGYVVTPYVGGVAQTPATFSSPATTETVTGLNPGTGYTFTVAARNSAGTGAASPSSSTVTPVTDPSITTSSVSAAEVGVGYSQTLQSTGGTAPVSWAVTSGSLPAGLQLGGSSGAITGTPTTPGSTTVTITATDADQVSVARTYTFGVNADPSITTPTLAAGDSGSAYSQPLASSGGTGALTWAITSGSLPQGLTLDASTGTITGTIAPTATSQTFTVRLTDGDGKASTQTYTITVNGAPSVSTPSLAGGDTSAAYHQTVTTTGGTGPYTYTVTGGSLPPGLTLDATTGVISGTPTATGSTTFTVTSTDADGRTATKSLTVVVGGPPSVTTASLVGADSGTAYSQTLAGTGGTGPYTWAIASGALPSGLTLNPATGIVSGTPSGAGSSTFTIAMTDAAGGTSSRTYTVPVNAQPTLTATSLGTADDGAPVDVAVPVSGGSGPLTYSVTSGSLPPGLSLGPSTGTITGTPTATGPATFTVTVSDADGATTTRSYTMPVNAAPAITTPSMPAVDDGTTYDLVVTGSGGTGTYTYSVTGGSLPAGLTLNPSTGAVTGTPTGSGQSTFTVTLQDTDGGTAIKTFALVVDPPPAFTGPTISGADIGAGYSATPSSTGGTGPFTYAVTSGSLPAGLTLNPATGAISGTPSALGSTTFTITETDADGDTASRTYTLTVGTPPTIITPALPTAAVGATYDEPITTTNGAGPFTWSVTSSTLPAGLALDPATGAISGTPSSPGTSTFTVTVTDANHQSASHVFALQTISRPSIITASVPRGAVGVPYSAPLAATGGTAPYWWSGEAGLPAGLSVNGFTGAIAGSPTMGGPATFTVHLTDSLGQTTTRSYSVDILPAPLNSRPIARTPDGKGYWLVGEDGAVLAFGDAHSYGSLAGHPLNQPIVAMAATPDGKGYWLAGTDGGVFCFGDARFHGSAGSLRLNKPILGMAATPDGGGYWLVASDGGVFSYGDARFYGSTGSIRLNRPVVGMAADSNGRGYWLVASDGGIFSFGSAPFYGSTGSMHLNKPVDGMAATPDNRGYWMVASDGGIFSFGDARFHGSLGNVHLVQPITGMAATPDGGGYWMSAADGGVFAGGDAGFYGSGAGRINQVIP